jgi:nitrite reductase/ring-hydroxylating ferredoxin subunit
MKRIGLLLFFLMVVACEKIPENPVYGSVKLTLYLQDRDKVLRGIPSYRTYLYSKPGVDYKPQQGERIGLGGLLVVHTPLDEYCAFDLACPNESTPNRNTIVEVDEDGIHAVCRKCGTKYQIMNGTGIALEGKKFGLRRYNVSVSGSTGVVTN